MKSKIHKRDPRGGGNEMPENGHLNGPKKRYFWNFLVFLILGSVEGGEGRKPGTETE